MAFVPSNLPEQRVYQDHVFPLTLTWTQSESENVCPMDWLQINASNVDSLLRKHRAILFRCSNLVRTHEEFDKIIEALNYNCMDYVGGAAVRTQLTSRVFTANESPSSENIPFHHEMAQTPDPPTHLFFFCEVPPTQGGATPILISSEVCERMQKLHPVFMDELDKCGVRYVRVMSEYDDPTSAIGRGWRSTFQCTDRGKFHFVLFVWIYFVQVNIECTCLLSIVAYIHMLYNYLYALLMYIHRWCRMRVEGIRI